MIKTIDSTKFKFNFFLGGMIKVKSLKEGASNFGGATKYKNDTYSNIKTDNNIEINKDNNKISLFVPSTIDVNNKTDNDIYINAVIRKLEFRGYDYNNIKFYDTKGSWYSEDNKEVVVEDITIITVSIKELTENDINNFREIANYLKLEMSQEGVSIAINNALAIV